MTDQNPLIYVSQVQDLVDLDAEMNDPHLAAAMEKALKIIASDGSPENIAKVAPMISLLSAYALEFRMQYANYMTWKKGTDDANYRKNCYRSMYDGLDNLVDSLKYLIK